MSKVYAALDNHILYDNSDYMYLTEILFVVFET